MSQSKRFRLLALLFMVATPVLAAPVADGYGLPLLGGRLYPTLGIDQRHESNYLRTPAHTPAGVPVDPLDTWITVLRPKLAWNSFSGERAARAYRVEYSADIGTVQSARNNDYVDQRAYASGNWEVNLTNRLYAEYEFLRWHDRRGSGDPDDVSRVNFDKHPDLWKSNRFEAGWTITRPARDTLIDFWATHYARRYINNNQYMRDNDRITLNLRMSRVPVTMPKTRFFAHLWWQDIDYIRELPGVPTKDSEERHYMVGAAWEMTGKTILTAQGGYLGKDFESEIYKDTSDFAWELLFNWRPKRDRMVLDLATRRVTNEAAETFADSTVVSSYEANWVHHLRPERLWYEVGGWWTVDDYVNTPRVDHRWYVRTGLYGRVKQRLLLGLEYLHEQRDSNLREAEYNNDVVQMTFEVAL